MDTVPNPSTLSSHGSLCDARHTAHPAPRTAVRADRMASSRVSSFGVSVSVVANVSGRCAGRSTSRRASTFTSGGTAFSDEKPIAPFLRSPSRANNNDNNDNNESTRLRRVGDVRVRAAEMMGVPVYPDDLLEVRA